MTKRVTVFVLKLKSSNLAVYTNLLHCYKHLCRVNPPSIVAKFPSYNTFNRKLKVVGSIMEIDTEMGVYAIEHQPLRLTTAV